jgi:membrane protease YdiL (CAAX protease family)
MQAQAQPQGINRAREAIALLLGPGVVYAVLITMSCLKHGGGPEYKPVAWAVAALGAIYLVVFGGWQFGVLRLLLRGGLERLSFKPGRFGSDLAAGALIFVAMALANALVDYCFKTAGHANESLARATYLMSKDPALLLASLFPGIWLGAALMEEFTRSFLLSGLVRLFSGWPLRAAAVLLSAGLFAAVHIYQGPYGIINAGVLGLILAGAYLFTGRFWPLVLAHGFFNSFLILYWVVCVHWNLWEF